MDKMLRYLAYLAAAAAALFANVPEAVRWLLLIMGLDILTGTILAAKNGELSSAKAWSGGMKKVGTLAVIGLVLVLERGLVLFPGLPLVAAVTGYYIWTEALSVITNAAALGVPIPDILLKALADLNPGKLTPPPVIAPPAPADDPMPPVIVPAPTLPPQDPRLMRGP